MNKNSRAFELDLLRGWAILMMIFHHLSYDLIYIFEINLGRYIESDVYNHIVHPIMLIVFTGVSGVCCVFSKNNFKRALKMLVAALVLSIGMAIASWLTQSNLYVFFNILHLVTVGTFLYACIQKIEYMYLRHSRKEASDKSNFGQSTVVGHLVILFLAIAIFISSQYVERYNLVSDNIFLLPIGIIPRGIGGMGDYLPMIPWLGFFMVGTLVGRLFYTSKKTLFPKTPNYLRKIFAPLEWLGQNSLWIYLLHQPIIMIVLFAGRAIKVW
ncbi:MAG: DUF1624 domain-containing protein [Clostridiaceae bacterium]|nr:DUF1624 domain-containing protein [Clostridiaceae bacterium]